MPALDLTTRTARIGNPASTYASANARDWNTNRYPRGVTDIQVFNSRLYLGAGEWNYSNNGPIPFLSYDPAISAIGGAGASAATADQDGIDRYAVVNGALVAIGADGHSGATNLKLSYYKLEGGSFVAYEATVTGDSQHGFDMIYWDGKHWFSADSGGVYYQTTLGSGGVGGVTWSLATGAIGFVWHRKFFTIGTDLYIAKAIATTGASGGTGNYLSKVTPGSTAFSAVAGSTYAFLVPGSPASGNYPLSAGVQTDAMIHRAVNFPTSGTLVYTVAESVTGYRPHDLCVWTPGTNPVSKMAQMPSGFRPMDLVVDGSTLYVVGYYTVGPDTVGSLVSTTNLTTWTEVATFKPNLIGGTSQGQAVPRSADVLYGKLYIGLAGTDPTLTQPNNVGDLLSLNLRWLSHVDQDWPMAGANPARTSNQATEVVGTSLTATWKVAFSDRAETATGNGVETLHQAVAPIVSAGNVVIGTLQGRLYSFATGATKAKRWQATIGAPIVSSACSDGTRAYVADEYGRVTAVTLTTGVIAWGPTQVTQGQWAPIRGHLLYADSKVIASGEDGVLYALNPSTGAVLWQRDTGAAIQHGAAWSNATGTGLCVVGSADMRVRAINSATGAVVWTSDQLYGAAFNGYFPVIDAARLKVLIRPWARLPAWVGGGPSGLHLPYRGIAVASGSEDNVNALSDTSMTAALDLYRNVGTRNHALTLYVLSLADGSFTVADQVLHQQWSQTMNGPNPAVTIDAVGDWVMPMIKPAGMVSSFQTGWAKIIPSTGKARQPLLHLVASGTDGVTNGTTAFTAASGSFVTVSGSTLNLVLDGDAFIRTVTVVNSTSLTMSSSVTAGTGRTWALYLADVAYGYGARDENLAASSCSTGILAFHCEEQNANFTGFWDAASSRWSPVSGAGSGTAPLFINTQAGGAQTPAVSGGRVYHAAHAHTLVAIGTV